MSRIKIKNWPFDKEDLTTLLDISKPFRDKGKWFFDAIFYCNEKKQTRKVKCELGMLILLKQKGIYQDGQYLRAQSGIIEEIIINPDNAEIRLIRSKYNSDYDKYNMSVWFNNKLYVFSLIELLKTILAPDIFCLNLIFHYDTYQQYFTYLKEYEKLNFNFTPEVNVKYITGEKIKHLSWMFSNKEVLEMISELHKSLLEKSEIKFKYKIKGVKVSALVYQHRKTYFANEILEVNGKRINAEVISVSHPKLISKQSGSGSQKHTTISLADNNMLKQIEADSNASSNVLDLNKNINIVSSYINHVPIKRNNLSEQKTGVIDENTKKAYRTTNNRSTAEAGGQNAVTKLEFENLDNLEGFSTFERIVMALKEIELLDEVNKVECKIGILSEYRGWGTFITLDDSEINRKYLVSQIYMNDGRKAILIEIENGNRALSTLLLVGSNTMNTSLIADNIIKGAIKRSGAWDYEIIMNLSEKYNFCVNKFRHTKVPIEKLVERIMCKIEIK